MDDVVNRLARELSDAISAALADDARVEAARERARAAGFEMKISLEAVIGFMNRSNSTALARVGAEDDADGFAGFKILGVIALLEVIKLLQNRYRNSDVVFSKIKDGVVFIDDDRGVEYEDFLFLLGFRHAAQRTWFTKCNISNGKL